MGEGDRAALGSMDCSTIYESAGSANILANILPCSDPQCRFQTPEPCSISLECWLTARFVLQEVLTLDRIWNQFNLVIGYKAALICIGKETPPKAW